MLIPIRQHIPDQTNINLQRLFEIMQLVYSFGKIFMSDFLIFSHIIIDYLWKRSIG